MKKLKLLFSTLRYLKLSQIAYRLYYIVRKPKLIRLQEPKLRGRLRFWGGERFLKAATRDGITFNFLGHVSELKNNWNNSDNSKLWLYNLHYQDDLNSIDADDYLFLCRNLIIRWISENPPFEGNGWEPYCLSLRIVNWVKWFARQKANEIHPDWLRSLSRQADALEQQLEFHILANHLFANAKALVFAGSFLGGAQGDALLKKGTELLDSELEEQFLQDGGHYERSPMYHAILLWDLCDLIQLQKDSQLSCLNERSEKLRKTLVKGMFWLRKMVHPDGDISFFNDSSFGVAPKLEDLDRYCSMLGIDIGKESIVHKSWVGYTFKTSGYIIVDNPNKHRAFFNVGEISPNYQPGHSHADTLSFELSLFGQRLFVNSGTSQYGMGAVREFQRSTRAHNTVEVDRENSSEVWAGFRVAKRAKTHVIETDYRTEGTYVSASHDGYCRFPGNLLTKRTLLFEEGTIQVNDQLSGNWSEAISRFYCHPFVSTAQLNEHSVMLTLPRGQKIYFSVQSPSKLRLVDSLWYPEFGVSISNVCIEVVMEGPDLISRINYS